MAGQCLAYHENSREEREGPRRKKLVSWCSLVSCTGVSWWQNIHDLRVTGDDEPS